MFSMIQFAFQSYTDIIKIYKNLYKFHTIHSYVLLNNFFLNVLCTLLYQLKKLRIYGKLI